MSDTNPRHPLQATTAAAHDVLLALIDISGYTKFLVGHRKAQTHAQMIVGALLERLIAEIGGCFDVAEIEGDALFIYAKDDGSLSPAERGECLMCAFRAFNAAIVELSADAICRCPGCANLDQLRVKVVVHFGRAVISKIGSFTKVSGVDVVIAHRLLKNSVPHDEYVLMTEDSVEQVTFPDDLSFKEQVEHYDEIGDVRIRVAENIAGRLSTQECDTPRIGTSNVGFEILRHEIRSEYAEVATEPAKGFHFHTGRHLAELLGYSVDDIEWAPRVSLDSFAGTGNPFSIGEIQPGEHVLDIGCGAGFDTLLAARRVGPSGRVIGIDMTPEMLERARSGVEENDLDNVTVLEGYAEKLPVDDGWADVIISNGVFNLCPNKPVVLKEMFRALRPGGRLQIGDILIQKALPESAKHDIDLWAG